MTGAENPSRSLAMQRRIIFTKPGANSAFGNFEPGMVARVPDAFARHLVLEARVARFDDPEPVAQPAPTERTRAVRPKPFRKR